MAAAAAAGAAVGLLPDCAVASGVRRAHCQCTQEAFAKAHAWQEQQQHAGGNADANSGEADSSGGKQLPDNAAADERKQPDGLPHAPRSPQRSSSCCLGSATQ